MGTVFANAPLPMRSFVSQAYHYSIHYPASWQCHAKDQGVVVFNTQAASVNIQTIYTKKGGGHYASVKDLMDDFQSQVPRHTQHAHFLERHPFVLTQTTGEKLTGEATTLTFYENGQTLKQWQIMLISRDGLIFQAWAYRAPVKEYADNLTDAVAMLRSWVID